FLLGLAVARVRRVHLGARSNTASNASQRLLHWMRPQLRNRPMLWKELFVEQSMRATSWWGALVVPLLMTAVLVPSVIYFAYCVMTNQLDDFVEMAMVLGGFLL